jgi:hypothetical protein
VSKPIAVCRGKPKALARIDGFGATSSKERQVLDTERRHQYLQQLAAGGRSRIKRIALQQAKRELLRSENGSTKLFKYTNLDSAQKILQEAPSLLLRPPEFFNDPFDCLANVATLNNETRFAPTPSEIGFIEGEVGKLPFRYRPPDFKMFHDQRASYRYVVSCFSTGYKSHLMWSHYSDHHKGICLEYDIGDIIDDIHPCIYTDDLAQFDWSNNSKVLAIVKNTEWAYETEWRYVRETVRPRMRLLGSVLHQIYNWVHSNPEFTKGDYEKWSTIQDSLTNSLQEEYSRQQILQLTPTRIFLGARFQSHQTNVDRAEICKSIVKAARTFGIPISKLTTSNRTFDLQEFQVESERPSWLELDPDLRASLPPRIEDETGVLG